MKMKKMLAVMLTTATVLATSACGNSAPAEAPVQETATEETTSEEAVAEEPASEETVAEATAEESVEAEPEAIEETETEESAEITVTDMIGREVAVTPGSYKKVVCIGAGALRMYSYIGDVNLLAGVEDIDNETLEERPKMFDSVARPYVLAYGDVFSTLPSCGVGGPNAQAAEAEKILECDPDIVISEYEDVEKEDALQEQLGVPVITLKAGPMGVFDDSFSGSMALLGQIFDNEAKATELVNFIAKEKEDISGRTADIKEEDKPSVYICGLGNWGTTNHLMTAQKYVSFNVANVKNVVTDLEKDGIQEIEAEKFAALGENTDIMFIDAAAVKNIKPLYEEDNTMFDSMKAWQDGNVYLEMAYNAYYTNYEIALINTWYIAKTVYPEQFEDIDITEKTNEVTKAFFGKELADEIFSAPASFGGYQQIDTKTFFN
jgi:iron complex transport system substrate-binding protein